uniref:H-type lectin domain-containing protein n=1 Tax=Enterocloster aldenensis TaxID=358742 RepID=UPI0035612EDF
MITVKGRELIIPRSERQIGTPYDNNAEVRHIRIDRVTSGGIDIANLNYRLDLEYANNVLDTCLLDVEVQEEYILLTWTIPDTCLTQKGTVWIAVRAYDENGSIKWATNRGAVYVGHTIFDGPAYTGKLSELEQLEERITQKTEILDANESERKEAEEQRKVNEERRVNNEAEWQRQAETAINTANETLREAKEQAGIATQKATESTQKAKESSDSATAAAGSAATASEKEAVATQKAKEASDSATAAAGSAAVAGEKEATATQKAKESSDSATAAAGSAVVAGEKEATATQKAAEAKNSADDAKRYAEQCAGVAGFDGTASTVSAIDTQGVAVRKASGTGHVTITAGGPEPDVGLEYFGQPGDKVTVQDMCDSLAAPGFDDSGVVQGISGFSDFLNRMTSGMRLPSFFRDLKAGLKFVLHTGQLVNNGLCNEPGKYPLDAAYGRTLLEMIGNTANLPGGAADIVSAIVAQNSNLANGYPSSICVKDELKNSLIKIQGFSDGNAGISLNKADGTIHRLLFNSDGRLRYGKYNNTWSISDILTNLEVQRGSTPGISCAANAITESTITFPNAFKSAPKVVVGFYSDTKLAAYGMMTPMVCNVTTTNFKVRIANASNTALTPAIYWIARE